MSLFKSAAIGAACSLIGFAATAADYGDPMFAPPPLEAERPMELGTGWYLRGDTTWSSTVLPRLNGDGSLTANNKKSSNYAFGLGAGYKFNNWFRADFTFDVSNIVKASRTTTTLNDGVTNIICPNNLTVLTDPTTNLNVGYLWSQNAGTCSERQNSTQRTMFMMLNAYLDLGTWNKVTPYVGAGIGTARIDLSANDNFYRTSDGALYAPAAANWTLTAGTPVAWHNGQGPVALNYVSPTIPNTTTPVSVTTPPNWNQSTKSIKYNFAWSVMAGVAIDVAPHAKLDIGYRYMNYSDRSFKRESQEVRVGFRYAPDY